MPQGLQVLVTEPMHAAGLQRLQAVHQVHYDPTLHQRPAEIIAAAPALDALVVMNKTQVRGALLDALQRCRCIGRLGVGLDNIDVEGCRARGIAVLPATGANAQSVAEYVITTAMMLRRPGSYTETASVAAGLWPRQSSARGRELAGAVLGIVGFGGIGQLLARLALALGMQVLAAGRSSSSGAEAPSRVPGVQMLPLDELLQRCDVLSLHVPQTAQTQGLIGARELALMKPDAVLINTARGPIVDAPALLAALRSGRLFGAALDVFDTEPLPANSLFAHPPPQLLLTAHVGSATQQSDFRVGDLVASRVLDALRAPQAPTPG